MNWLDWVIVAAVVLVGLIGYWRGLVRSIAWLLALILAIVAAVLLYPAGASLLSGAIHDSNTAAVVSFVVILIIAYPLARFLLKFVVKLFRLPGLSCLNRIAGALVGLVLAVLAVIVLSALLAAYPIEAIRPAVEDSVIIGFLSGLLPVLKDLLTR